MSLLPICRPAEGLRKRLARWGGNVFLSSVCVALLAAAKDTLPRLPVEIGERGRPASDEAAWRPQGEDAKNLRTVRGVIRAGVGFTENLALAGLDPQIIPHIARRLAPALDFRRLRAGDRFTAVLEPGGDLVSLTYEKTPLEALVLRSTPGGWTTELETLPAETRIAEVRGAIRSSLFEAMDRAGESDALTLAFAELFAWDIDFAHELQPGDSFRVVVEKVYRDRRFVQYGRILAAEYRQREDRHAAYFFPWPDARGDYFTAEGRSVRASFLRSPISYTRISSGFSGARLHPVLNRVRPHLGVDFAAPEGTPVWAPADGQVIARGREGEGGNRITLRHRGGYETSYLHLSRFASGLAVGDRVRQKEVIGYVGSTGLATGPHLDYRVRRNGIWVNPVTEAFPRAERLPEEQTARFAEYRAFLDGETLTPLLAAR
ncbi:MAG TPA: peptidoglycan DD-metalloendopeptidase family protein [Candidatus Methanoperedens sp.]|nr:peptidoglycan DD-metalloendopeptidase family protein [Candidatus Methanoperedens sp.]